jgi:hypothetical protein
VLTRDPRRHQARLAQDAQVAADRRAAHREVRGDLARPDLPVGQALEDRPAYRVRERIGGEHGAICNHVFH